MSVIMTRNKGIVLIFQLLHLTNISNGKGSRRERGGGYGGDGGYKDGGYGGGMIAARVEATVMAMAMDLATRVVDVVVPPRVAGGTRA